MKYSQKLCYGLRHIVYNYDQNLTINLSFCELIENLIVNLTVVNCIRGLYKMDIINN